MAVNPRYKKWYYKMRDTCPPILTLHRKKFTSKRKGMKYNLSYKWLREVYTGKCELTKIPFKCKAATITPFSYSFDRINPNKGYTIKNTRIILNGVNGLKGNGKDSDMYLIAYALIKNLTEERKSVIHDKWTKLMESKNV